VLEAFALCDISLAGVTLFDAKLIFAWSQMTVVDELKRRRYVFQTGTGEVGESAHACKHCTVTAHRQAISLVSDHDGVLSIGAVSIVVCGCMTQLTCATHMQACHQPDVF
jgi:hypothetical protein